MNLTLKIWRQKSANNKGKIVEYKVTNISSGHVFFRNDGYFERRLNQ